nr:hypothetical 6K protein - human cytomegalovirus (strain AD169) [Human betaherpesvirus 5]
MAKRNFFFHCLEVSPATTTTAVVSGWRSRRNSSSLKKKVVGLIDHGKKKNYTE